MDGGNSWFFLSSVSYKGVRRAFSRLPPPPPQKKRGMHPISHQKTTKILNVSIHTDLHVRVDHGMYMHAKAVYWRQDQNFSLR